MIVISERPFAGMWILPYSVSPNKIWLPDILKISTLSKFKSKLLWLISWTLIWICSLASIFPFIVAPISEFPDLNSIEAFKIPSTEGINFLPKVWHFPLIATEDSNFLTIDKKDFKNNLEIYNFQNNHKIFVNYE